MSELDRLQGQVNAIALADLNAKFMRRESSDDATVRSSNDRELEAVEVMEQFELTFQGGVSFDADSIRALRRLVGECKLEPELLLEKLRAFHNGLMPWAKIDAMFDEAGCLQVMWRYHSP